MVTDGQLAMVHLVEKFRRESPFAGLAVLLETPHVKVSMDWLEYLGLSETEILAELQRWRLDHVIRIAADMIHCSDGISREMAQIARAFGESDYGREWAAEFARQTWATWR